jgi:transcription antitermination factor NusG
VNQQETKKPPSIQFSQPPAVAGNRRGRKWYAVFTIPQHEKSVAKHLGMREIESFLPTYESVRTWKNRQRVKIDLPLFPTYVFVHIDSEQRGLVLQSPGVLQIVGSSKESIPVHDSEIELLRSGACRARVEPFHDLVIGERVRIKSGIMQGIEGTLVRKCDGMRFVLNLKMINQNAAIKIDADELESVPA